MSSCVNSKCYLPVPPRTWSRVQNECTYNTDIVIDTNTRQMLEKGNVLQYKKNSSEITAKQKYALIAKGKWKNRNVNWAVQNDNGYTNPNINNLKRGGNVKNIAIDPKTGSILGDTNLPVTCPTNDIPTYDILPINNTPPSSDTIIPSSKPPGPSDYIPSVPPYQPPAPIVIQDGGNLICNVHENICSGKITYNKARNFYKPTTDSDVPGPIQELYWKDGTATWYPKIRRTMDNSVSKWPYTSGSPNDITFVSAVHPLPPVLISAEITDDVTILKWSQDESCIPATKFIIIMSDNYLTEVNGDVRELTVNISSSESFYIIASNNIIISKKSNILTT